ncbi:hypothetical protein R1flu_026505 [Riccia fluitans]|uniref:F-box associated domain-containing protein n=1 Tax=Riccia fluitans TaxID=41844 RepID=A0ABD1XG61_9MARC
MHTRFACLDGSLYFIFNDPTLCIWGCEGAYDHRVIRIDIEGECRGQVTEVCSIPALYEILEDEEIGDDCHTAAVGAGSRLLFVSTYYYSWSNRCFHSTIYELDQETSKVTKLSSTPHLMKIEGLGKRGLAWKIVKVLADEDFVYLCGGKRVVTYCIESGKWSEMKIPAAYRKLKLWYASSSKNDSRISLSIKK